MIIEIESRWFAIVNPVAGEGKGLTDWPTISKLLRDNDIAFDFAFTERKFHAVELSVEAINKGYRRIIIVGGDGTIHEVVNGVFIQKKVPTIDILLSVIAVGTGNDWIKMFGIPRKYTEAIRSIVEGHSFLQDIGKVSFFESNYSQHRYMANVAGIGFDACVNKKYNQLKDEGRKSRYLYIWSTLKAIFKYKSTGVQVIIDGNTVVNEPVYSATIAIGKYNGGGMQQAPQAVADDGLFDVTVIRKIGRLGVIKNFRTLYNGRIYDIPKTSLNRGRVIEITSTPGISIEIDGEALGYSPFRFEMIDKAIKVVVAERFLKEMR